MSKTTMIKTDLEIKGPIFFFQTQNLSKSEHTVYLTGRYTCLLFSQDTLRSETTFLQKQVNTWNEQKLFLCTVSSECLITSWANNVIISLLQDYFSIQWTQRKKSWQRTKATTGESCFKKGDTFVQQWSALTDWTEKSNPFPSFIQDTELLKSIFSLPQYKDLSAFLRPKEVVRIWLTELPTLFLTVTRPQKSPKLFALLQLKFRLFWFNSEYLDGGVSKSRRNTKNSIRLQGISCFVLLLSNHTTICWRLFP